MVLYDVVGRLFRSLYEGTLEASPHLLDWDGGDEMGQIVPPGVYMVRALDVERGPLADAKLIIVR